MPYSLQGRRVLVTAGSRGLGAMIVEKFARDGAHVVVNFVSNEGHARAVATKAESYGVQAFVVQGVCSNNAI